MSAQERSQERTLADFYEGAVRAGDKPSEPHRTKRFLEAVATGYALGAVWRMLTK